MLGGSWETSAAVALGTTLLLTPVMRRIAMSTGIVDVPAARKLHTAPVPYLGGVAIACGVLAGLIVGPPATWRLGVVAAAAIGLGVVGLMDDRAPLDPLPRLLVHVVAAIGAVGAGVSAHVTGVSFIDAALTVCVIVAVTNAFNLIDNMDGLAAGVALASCAGLVAAAQINGQVVLGAMAASVGAASWAFLAYNIPPASIFMGDAGALFVGFCVAVAAIELDPVRLSHVDALAIASLLVIVPAADLLTVVVSRRRRGVSIMTAGKDHLSHRLVGSGLPQERAVGRLVLVQATGSAAVVAVLAGVLPIPAAVVVTTAAGAIALGRLHTTPLTSALIVAPMPPADS